MDRENACVDFLLGGPPARDAAEAGDGAAGFRGFVEIGDLFDGDSEPVGEGEDGLGGVEVGLQHVGVEVLRERIVCGGLGAGIELRPGRAAGFR